MKKKRLFWANIIQSIGSCVFVAGLITFFVSFIPLRISGVITALGAVMHIGAMIWGIKMEGGSGRLPRGYLEKGPTA